MVQWSDQPNVYSLGEFCHRFLNIEACFSTCFGVQGFVFLIKEIHELVSTYIDWSVIIVRQTDSQFDRLPDSRSVSQTLRPSVLQCSSERR